MNPPPPARLRAMRHSFAIAFMAVSAHAANLGGQGGGGGSSTSAAASAKKAAVGAVMDRLSRQLVEADDEATIGGLIERNRLRVQRERAAQLAAARRAWRYAPPRMFVVANRLPLSVKRNEQTGRLEYTVSSGGMVSALLGVQLVRTIWVGWCPVPEDTTPAELQEVERTLRSRGCIPIFLPADEAAAYYNGFCNDVLWPLFHYVVSRTPDEDHDGGKEQAHWLAYQRVNAKFADVVSSLARESDLVWVHDYHLMLLPSMLRERRAQLKVGWFLHTPWPSSEIFRTLPQRQEVLRGLLGADLVGFHVYDYARHFLHACTRLMGSEVSFSSRRLRWERPVPADLGGGVMQHSLKVDAFPIGIDPRRFRRGLESPRVKERISQLRKQFEGVSLLLGVDRVDYIKGIPQKLLAMESLLAQRPELVGKVVLLQIAVPTRTEVPEYQKLRSVAHRLVGRINGRFGTPSYTPIHYLDQSIEFEEMVALYHVADVCIVTSLRDGMNLVSYEYIACQDPAPSPVDDELEAGPGSGAGAEGAYLTRRGVLVLSEFAGAAQTLGAGCVRVNPYNVEELARGLAEAISMGEEQRAQLHAYGQGYIDKYTSQSWAQSFIASLEEQDADGLGQRTAHAQPLALPEVVSAYANATRRLLVLGIGGTFLPATGATANDFSSLTPEQLHLLARLLEDPANTVLLTSGRARGRMEELMSGLMVSMGDDGLLRFGEGGYVAGVVSAFDALATGEERADGDLDSIDTQAGGGGASLDLVSSQVGVSVDGVEGTYRVEANDAGGASVEAQINGTRVGGTLWALAESGVFSRVGSGAWGMTLQAAQSDEWLESVEEVFRYFEERTPGSRVERRDRTIRWAYGAAEAQLGAQQASNLVEHLEKLLGDAPVERSWEGTTVEVRPHGASIGHGLMQLLASDFAKAETASNAAAAIAAAAAAAQDGQAEATMLAAAAAAAATGSFSPRGFDFVLALGNFSTRDEDAFLRLHEAEVRPEDDDSLSRGAASGDSEGLHAAQDGPAARGAGGDASARHGEEAAGEYENSYGDGPAEWAPPEEHAPLEVEAPHLSSGDDDAQEGRLTMRALEVPAGGVFSVILGNRSTHARYFLPTEVEATQLLHALAETPQSVQAAEGTAERLASRAAAEAAKLASSGRGPGALVISESADQARGKEPLPSALERSTLIAISKRIEAALTPAFCLDYDGTLAPIVEDPTAARLPPGMRGLLRELANRHPTAIVSGRSMDKLLAWVNVSGLYYAGSHGFEILGPHGSRLNYTFAESLLPSIQEALDKLTALLYGEIDGVMIEDNKFALSVHTRNVSSVDMPRLDALLEAALEEQPLLGRSEGKCVIELRPQVHWHKGRAVEWLLKNMCEQMGLPGGAAERTKMLVPVYIGDDTTDEDAFEELRERGNGIAIRVAERPPMRSETAAEFWLRQTEVNEFLALFLHEESVLMAGAGGGGEEEQEDAGDGNERALLQGSRKAEAPGGDEASVAV